MSLWVALKENVRLARILWIITEVCSNLGFLLELWKNYQKLELQGNLTRTLFLHGPMILKVMKRSAWKDIANWRTQQLNNFSKVATPCPDDHQFKEEELGSVGEVSQVWSQIVLTCLYLARIGRPDLFLASKQTCSISHQVDKSLWPTFSSFDLIHSSHKRLPTILSCGKYCSALSIGFVPRLRLCWRSWTLKINVGVNLMYLWKSNISAHELDVHETNVSIPQFYRIGNHFVGCWIANGWITCTWFKGCVIQVLRSSNSTKTSTNQQQGTVRGIANPNPKQKGELRCWSIVACGLRHHKRKFFSKRISVVHLWRQ